MSMHTSAPHGFDRGSSSSNIQMRTYARPWFETSGYVYWIESDIRSFWGQPPMSECSKGGDTPGANNWSVPFKYLDTVSILSTAAICSNSCPHIKVASRLADKSLIIVKTIQSFPSTLGPSPAPTGTPVGAVNSQSEP